MMIKLIFTLTLAIALFSCSSGDSDSEEISSSSAIEQSSSSIIQNNSSSSVTISSSSDIQTSSSSSIVTSSSSSVISSSSNVATSSSSSNAPLSSSSSSWYWPLNNYHHTYDTLTDPRDGQKYFTYKATTLNGATSITVMAQNLNYGTMVPGGSGQSNDAVAEKYCYDNDPENCDHYGGLYQWAEAMGLPSSCNTVSCAHLIADTANHQGLCPPGWRVLTRRDFNLVISSSKDAVTGVRSETFGGTNTSGYTLLGGGGYIALDGGFASILERAVWNYPNEVPTDSAMRSIEGTLRKQSTSMVSSGGPKTNARSLRCVKVE